MAPSCSGSLQAGHTRTRLTCAHLLRLIDSDQASTGVLCALGWRILVRVRFWGSLEKSMVTSSGAPSIS